METKQIRDPRRTDVQPHRLGMGWHFVWRCDPPIVHQGKREDGSSYEWEEDGETSEGCIMWLADQFAGHMLGGATARSIYRDAYRQRDGEAFDDEWLATEALKDEWEAYTVSPQQWSPIEIRQLMEDLEDVNYHSFLARLIELVKERAPELASALHDWCADVSAEAALSPAAQSGGES